MQIPEQVLQTWNIVPLSRHNSTCPKCTITVKNAHFITVPFDPKIFDSGRLH